MALKANIVIDQGSDFQTTIDVTDDDGNAIDLSTYTGAAQIRKHYTSSNAFSFTVTASNTGVVTLSMTSGYSANITPGRYVYDCELTDPSSKVTRLVEGIVTVTPQVTR
jgi:hypothetical protein